MSQINLFKPFLLTAGLGMLTACAGQSSNNPRPEVAEELNAPPASPQQIELLTDAPPTKTDEAPAARVTTDVSTEASHEITQTSVAPHITEAAAGDAEMTVMVVSELTPNSLLNQQSVITAEDHASTDTADRQPVPPATKILNFRFNHAGLTGEEKSVLDAHAEYLKANSDVRVVIHGHTDQQGNADYNLMLSKARATYIFEELKQRGVPAHQLEITAWGGTQPLNDPLHFAENRRVVLEYNPGTVQLSRHSPHSGPGNRLRSGPR